MNKGFVLIFDATNGAGKTTTINSLKKILESKQINYFSEREPGGTEINEQIRTYLRESDESKNLSDFGRMLFFLTCRANLYEKKVVNSVKDNGIFIADRGMLSTYVYQIASGDLKQQLIDLGYDPLKLLLDLHKLSYRDLDVIYVYLDCSLETCRKRHEMTNNTKDNMEAEVEKEEIRYYIYRNTALEMASKENNWYIVNNEIKSPDEVAEEIFEKIIKPKINN